MNNLKEYIIEKLSINKDTKINNLSSYIVCVVRSKDLIYPFKNIEEKVICTNSDERYYTCLINVLKHKKELLKYYNEDLIGYYKINDDYINLDMDDFIEKYNKMQMIRPLTEVFLNYIKNMK